MLLDLLQRPLATASVRPSPDAVRAVFLVVLKRGVVSTDIGDGTFLPQASFA